MVISAKGHSGNCFSFKSREAGLIQEIRRSTIAQSSLVSQRIVMNFGHCSLFRRNTGDRHSAQTPLARRDSPVRLPHPVIPVPHPNDDGREKFSRPRHVRPSSPAPPSPGGGGGGAQCHAQRPPVKFTQPVGRLGGWRRAEWNYTSMTNAPPPVSGSFHI